MRDIISYESLIGEKPEEKTNEIEIIIKMIMFLADSFAPLRNLIFFRFSKDSVNNLKIQAFIPFIDHNIYPNIVSYLAIL